MQDINGNRPWHIEQHGLNAVPEGDKLGRPIDLFWVWFAANIGILSVLYGGIIMSYHLSFLQSLLAAAIGSLSFAIVGVLSVAGRDGGAPMLALSRAVFGVRGNLLPTSFSWINLLGWESVTVITGTLSLEALLQVVFGLRPSFLNGMISLILFGGLVIVVGLFGQATLVILQKVSTWSFGLLSLGVIVLLLNEGGWHQALSAPSGSWIGGFLPAVSIIMAGTGISWGNAAADYSRYQARSTRKRSIFSAVTLGSAIPVFVLIMVGVILTNRVPNLPTTANPIAAIGALLPHWMMVPYLITAVGGMLAQADLGLYSSGLNLLVLGARTARHKTVIVDAVIMTLVTVYVLFIRQNFMGPFEAFMSLGGVFLAAWEAVFIVDQWLARGWGPYPSYCFGDVNRNSLLREQSVQPLALVSFILGIVFGLLFTNSPFFNGPLAQGIFAGSNLGVLLAFLVSGITYAIVLAGKRTVRRRVGQDIHTASS